MIYFGKVIFMIKLIVSDIDGTLIPYLQSTLPEALFPLVRRLREAGIMFCPASGRQYHSLRRLFAPVADEVCFLCANGGVIYGPGREDSAPVLAKTTIPREDALALSNAIMALPDCEVLIDGANVSYVCTGSEALARDLTQRVGSLVRVVDRAEQIEEDIIKVSAFCPKGPEGAAKALGPRFAKTYHMAEAGPTWLDFMRADKGVGLRQLVHALGLELSEVAAFGDNWNDVPMLMLAGNAWVMETAPKAVLEQFPDHTSDVLKELERILSELT